MSKREKKEMIRTGLTILCLAVFGYAFMYAFALMIAS